MLERLPPTQRNLALGAIGILALAFAWTIRSVLNPLLLGYLLAFMLHPLVARLEAQGLPRRRAVNAIFASGFVLAVVGFGVVAAQGQALAGELFGDADVARELREKLAEGRQALADVVGERWVPTSLDPEGAYDLLGALYREHGSTAEAAGKAGLAAAGGALGFLRRTAGSALAVLGMLVLLPLYTYYLLFELERIHGFVRRYLPIRERERLSRVGRLVGEMLSSFFRGRILVCLLKGLFLALGLAVAGIDYALLLGLAGGFLSLLPFFGPFLGFVCAFLVGVIEHGLVGSLLRTGLVFGAGELVEGYVLIPRILGDSLGLHPVVVVVVLLAGGAALGLLGVLVALPVAATVVILVRELVLPALAQFADEEPEAG